MNELTTADPRSIPAHIKAHSDAIFRIKLFYYSVNFFLVQLFRRIRRKIFEIFERPGTRRDGNGGLYDY